MTMLSARGLAKTFYNGLLALDDVDLDVEDGEIAALIGPSGCGKSTLLRLIAGLETPTTGTLTVAGHPVAGPGRDVGVVFQEPRLMPWLTVSENIGFGVADANNDTKQAMVAEAMERVGLAEFTDTLPRELSGGMAQRVAIARALVVQPPVLLLDEPFSALDAFTRHDLQEHLLDLWSWYRPTTLLVTHDIDEAVTLADRILVMSDQPGRISTRRRIDLPRPRHRADPSFSRVREQTLLELGEARTERATTRWDGKLTLPPRDGL